MAYIPAYSYPCLASDSSGSNIYLAGVSSSVSGQLQVYTIDLTNINSPAATLLSSQTSTVFWSSSAPKACLSYAGNTASTNNPFLVQQFGPQNYFTNVFPNGTIEIPANFQGIGFQSNKLYSLSGAVGGLNWVTAVANVSSITTNSPWTGLRFNASSIVDSTRDFLLSAYPASNPLLSVGAYVASGNTPAQGYHIVFDKAGSGIVFTTLDSAAPIASSLDRVLTLSNPQSVDMSGNTLTNNAFSLTMASVGYILDRASDGSTVLYSINPSQSNKLQRVNVSGNVPAFSTNMVGTAAGSKIVTYGAANSGAVVFNSFDPAAGTWTGPGLVKPATSNSPSPSSGGNNNGGNYTGGDNGSSSKAPLGAIIGGVVGGLVVIALVAFLFLRHRRAAKKSTLAAPGSATSAAHAGGAPTSLYTDPSKMHNPAATPLMDQNYVLHQQQLAMAQNQQYQQQYQQQQQVPYQQQQQYNPHLSYLPQDQPKQDIYSSVSAIQVPQVSSPMIFQPQAQPQVQQEAYNYTPPTLIPHPQPQSPNIFQPQAETSPHHAYSQASYGSPSGASVAAVGGHGTPQTPPVSQTYAPSAQTSAHIPASPQYIAPPSGDHYAA
ncbi:hypothetical protein EDD11_004533 [Mortierella claussenii]|nr:hypothetical protein EDD11_004533 [Mortierella claussenii]